jgi:hypothetical protein
VEDFGLYGAGSASPSVVTMTGRRRLARATLDVMAALPLFVTAPLHRRGHLRLGATDAEVRRAMPGDAWVERPSFAATRAVTITAPPELVWPWIVQMGYRRAGFYTYALLDNAGYDSADTVLAEYQDVAVGDRMPMSGTVTDATAFTVTAFEPDRWLVWRKPDSTWVWTLTPVDGGTRLVTRLRAAYDWHHPLSAVLSLTLLEFGDYPMMRRMLHGIRLRAERLAAEPRAADGVSDPAPR